MFGMFYNYLPRRLVYNNVLSALRNPPHANYQSYFVCFSLKMTIFFFFYFIPSSISTHQFSSVTQLCPTLCHHMDCSTPGFPVYHQLLELALTHAQWWCHWWCHPTKSVDSSALSFLWRRQWQPTPVLLPGKSHGRRSLKGCSPWGLCESDTTEGFTSMHWRRKWQPTPVFLPGESQGWRSLVGCLLWGCTELDMTEVT